MSSLHHAYYTLHHHVIHVTAVPKYEVMMSAGQARRFLWWGFLETLTGLSFRCRILYPYFRFLRNEICVCESRLSELRCANCFVELLMFCIINELVQFCYTADAHVSIGV